MTGTHSADRTGLGERPSPDRCTGASGLAIRDCPSRPARAPGGSQTLFLRLVPAGSRISTSAGKNFQSFKRAKTNLDRLSGVIEWRLHDLRRTVVTGMARLGVPPHVADKILNHQSGTISGVAAVYQKHEFLVERKDALERWSRHVTDIIGSSSGSNPVSETGMNLETQTRDVSQRRSNKSDLTGCCGPGQLKEELDLHGASYGEKAPAAWRNHCVTLPK